VGFSAFVSVGSMLDVGWGDLISYLGDDPKTDSIVLYMESIGDARAFVSAARDVARQKPIIVIKAGRTEAAAEAAASHTGSLAGSDAVLRAAFRRTGVLRVDEINDLFNMAEVLAKQPRPRGPRLTILTNAGGPGVLATDALIDGGGELADLSDETMEALNGFLPEAWSHGNPIDILGDAGPDRYEKAIAQAVKDEASDGLLVVLTPQAMSDPIDTAQILTPYAGTYRKPILASWMGGSAIARSERLLNDAGLPTFPYPDTAARVFNNMWRYSYNLRGLYETPSLPEDKEGVPDRIAAGRLIGDAHEAGRTILTEHESKQVLAAYGIPVVTSYVKETADEAVAQANAIGYPVVLKLHSTTITHKTDVGGVQLNLEDEAAVRDAFARIRSGVSEEGFDGVNVQPMLDLDSGYELIVGSSIDAQFGPVLLFGAGGTLVEVFEDRALGLPPLNTTLARRMMEQTKIYKALRGVRGRQAVDLDALEDLMVRFSQLVVEQPRIKEIDINPLFARPKAKASDDGSAGAPGEEQGLVALDARVVLHPFDVGNDALPQSAIRPYPRQYCDTWTMKGGEDVLIRPIRPEDEPLLVDFHDHISERSVYMRYASLMKQSQRIAHERLSRMCFIDYDREMALVVEHPDEESGEPEIVAVGRLTKQFGTEEAEFAMLVLDAYQREGLGTELLRRLVEIGRDEGLSHITADILRQNRAMQRVCEKLGFEIIYGDVRDEMVKAVKAI
jgi:acetyltransferase